MEHFPSFVIFCEQYLETVFEAAKECAQEKCGISRAVFSHHPNVVPIPVVPAFSAVI
jgi:hypothetical protein